MAQNWKQFRRNHQLYLILLVPVVYMLVFHYVPMYGAQIAFKEYSPIRGIWGSPWVGLANFSRFFSSPIAWQIIGNTLAISFYQLAAGFPIPILLALALNNTLRTGLKKSAQMITYAPHFISTVVLVGMMFQFLSPKFGIARVIFDTFNIQPVVLMGGPQYFRHLYVWSGVWQRAGWGTIIYLSALSGISPDLHEAAVIDGANRIKRMWHIDIPGILPTVTILLIINIGRIMTVGFEKALLMQTSTNLQTSQIVATYVYQIGLRSPIPQFSYASAIGLFNNVINFALLLIVNRIARRISVASLW